jgi:ubiquitin-conjugating enzyme E2 Z
MSNAKRTIKRITKDINDIVNNDALRDQDKIFCIFSDKDIHDVKALIVGPKDTPYEGGFFFFTLRFSDNYPHKPPTAKMMTLSPKESVRFNPNLYVEGKVCLSILGTWSGPSWTVCMNMTTVLTSIQSLMGELPYRNEPGYESASKNVCKQYNDCIDYFTYHVAINGILKKPPVGFEEFTPIVEKLFVRDFEQYNKRLQQLKKSMNKKSVSAPSPFSSMKAVCDYDAIEAELNTFYTKLSPKYASIIAEEAEAKKKNVSDDRSKEAPKTDSRKNALFG